jgi:protein-disulfide isomerase
MLDGIPQHGIELGRPDAPVRLVEFADLKCPICRSYSQQVLPQLIQRYVRAGRVRMEFRVQHFVGEQRNPGDSLAAARMLQAVGSQNRLWNFAELFYYNQQDESRRYVTDGFVRGLAGAVHGLDVQRALRQRDDPGVDKALSSSEALFTANGFTGTPSFLIGRGSGPLRPLTWQRLTVSEFADPIQKLLGK